MLFSFFVFVYIHISCDHTTFDESLRRTGLHLSLAAKSSFYLPVFEISRTCRTASELRWLINKNSVILLLCRVFSYLCTYDLSGPVLNVFDACVGKKKTLFSFSSFLTFPWNNMHVLSNYLFCYFYGLLLFTF